MKPLIQSIGRDTSNLEEDLLFDDELIGYKERFDLIAIGIYIILIPLMGAYYLLKQDLEILGILSDLWFFFIFGAVYPVIFLVKNHKSTPIKFNKQKFTRSITFLFGGIICIVILSVVLGSKISDLLNQAAVRQASLSALDSLLIEFIIIIPVEEMFFRGTILYFSILILNLIECSKSVRNAIAVVINAVAFGLMHFPKYQTYYQDFVDSGAVYYIILELMVLGAFCAYISLKFGIFSAMVLHALNNSLANSGNLIASLGENVSLSFVILLAIIVIIIVIIVLQRNFLYSVVFKILLIGTATTVFVAFISNALPFSIPAYFFLAFFIVIPLFDAEKRRETCIMTAIYVGAFMGIIISGMMASPYPAGPLYPFFQYVFYGLLSVFLYMLLHDLRRKK
ncbi:MAG: CPBP family intramembrane metalloprotease [Candidatus Lokiarchaeota archaeon]|nr:CPBP family intramembrane metalloprotease [Candidatus Lokiarchaeota archaeon]